MLRLVQCWAEEAPADTVAVDRRWGAADAAPADIDLNVDTPPAIAQRWGGTDAAPADIDLNVDTPPAIA
ncbi:MAG: hypothetical protein OXH78_01490, partial [Acidimicrobiaceae bacterium]|nr:hypothetical protein [Acidimicrobiaceae bacterium]